MIGRLDVDEQEVKRCNDHNAGKKLPSYRKGFQAGLSDGQKTEIEKREKNPYWLSSEIKLLLRKRARWEAGYQYGWQIGSRKKKKRMAKRKKRRID